MTVQIINERGEVATLSNLVVSKIRRKCRGCDLEFFGINKWKVNQQREEHEIIEHKIVNGKKI